MSLLTDEELKLYHCKLHMAEFAREGKMPGEE